MRGVLQGSVMVGVLVVGGARRVEGRHARRAGVWCDRVPGTPDPPGPGASAPCGGGLGAREPGAGGPPVCEGAGGGGLVCWHPRLSGLALPGGATSWARGPAPAPWVPPHVGGASTPVIFRRVAGPCRGLGTSALVRPGLASRQREVGPLKPLTGPGSYRLPQRGRRSWLTRAAEDQQYKCRYRSDRPGQ